MRKIIQLIFMVFIFNNSIYAEDFILSTAEEIGKKTIQDGIKTFVIHKSIDNFYEKKFKNIIKIMDSSQASLKSHLSWLEKNANKIPKSSKKIASYKRKLVNIEKALLKAKGIIKTSTPSVTKMKHIRGFLKKVPVIEIGMEVYNELNTQHNVNKFIEKYPGAEALFDESGFQNEIVSVLFSNLPVICPYFEILKPTNLAYDIHDGFPDPSENRKDFLHWFKNMYSVGKDFKVIGKYVIKDGIKYSINSLPKGLKQYFRITTSSLKNSISKKELNTIKTIVITNKEHIKATAKNSSNGLYIDIYKYSNLYNNIQTLVSLNIMEGYSDGSFKPDWVITEEEAVKMVVNLFLNVEYSLYKNKHKNSYSLYSFLDNYFSNYPLARTHSWNKELTMTNFKISELLMRVIYKKVKGTNLLNKDYKNNQLLIYFNNYQATIDNDKGWDVFSTGLKAFNIYEGDKNSNFYKDKQVNRAMIANLLARAYRFVLKQGVKL